MGDRFFVVIARAATMAAAMSRVGSDDFNAEGGAKC